MMDEAEKDTAQIDVKAARINVEAAEIAHIAQARTRAAHKLSSIHSSALARATADAWPDKADEYKRQAELAARIAAEAQNLRDGARRIETLAREVQEAVSATALFGAASTS